MTSLVTQRYECGAPTALVLLPGVGMRADDFVEAGFFEAVRRRGLALDLVAVDLDVGGLPAQEALAALQADVLAPARQRYPRLWLGGISLGGLLTLIHVADTPGSVDGLCLLAPYPGSRLTTNAIERAGGLGVWQATAQQCTDPEFRAWRWLQQPPAELPVFIGWGREDRFAQGMGQMAARFGPEAGCVIPGGHALPVWQQLWERFLDRGHFAG